MQKSYVGPYMAASSASVGQNPWRPGAGDADLVADKESDVGGGLTPPRGTLSLHQSVVAAAATVVALTAPKGRNHVQSKNSQCQSS